MNLEITNDALDGIGIDSRTKLWSTFQRLTSFKYFSVETGKTLNSQGTCLVGKQNLFPRRPMTQATINNNLKPVGFLVNLSAKYSRKELTINFCSIWFEESKKVFHENDSSRTISCEYFIDGGTNIIFSPSPERIFPPNRITYAKQEKVFHRKRLSNNRGRGGSDGYLCLNRSRARVCGYFKFRYGYLVWWLLRDGTWWEFRILL